MMKEPTFADILSSFHRYIRRTLCQFRVPAREIEDVQQEVLRAIECGLPKFDPEMSANPKNALPNWIYAICKRQAANHHRAVRRRRERVVCNDELDLSPADRGDGEDSLVAEQRKAILHRVLATLEPSRRAVIVAYELEGIAMADVAGMLGIRVNTAWNRLRLAREDIRAAFRREDPEAP